MNKKITKNGNETIVKIFEGKNIYTGKAKVHPDDINFATDRVGSYIAESRARIKRHNKKAREHQKNIDKLLKEIKILETARDYHLEEEIMLTDFINTYIKRKDEFFNRINENRKNPKKVQEIAESIAQMFDKLNEVNECGSD